MRSEATHTVNHQIRMPGMPLRRMLPKVATCCSVYVGQQVVYMGNVNGSAPDLAAGAWSRKPFNTKQWWTWVHRAYGTSLITFLPYHRRHNARPQRRENTHRQLRRRRQRNARTHHIQYRIWQEEKHSLFPGRSIVESQREGRRSGRRWRETPYPGWFGAASHKLRRSL